MAVIEHPDMPNSIFGIQGFNPWNILLFFVIIGWAVSRQQEKLRWDMPANIKLFLFLYFLVMIIGFFHMLVDKGSLAYYQMITTNKVHSTAYLWSEYFINTIKWVIPGLLLFDGCRSRSRFMLAIFSLLAIYFLLGIQVIRWMPFSSLTEGAEFSHKSSKLLLNEIGYHRVNLSMMLAGASWAIFSTRTLINKKKYVLLITFASLLVLFAQALTGGRAGYGAWIIVGFILGSVRWRKYLLLASLLVVIMLSVMPGGMAERVQRGFTEENRDINTRIGSTISDSKQKYDLYSITSGRNVAWPYVTEKIWDAPFFGYGRLAMQRTGISTFLWEEYREGFPHPHNAYLEWLLDNGFIGFIPVIIFYLTALKMSMSLFCDSRSPVFTAIGGVTFALICALLVASIGSQTFYPREGSVGMWCAIGLMFRVYVERSRVVAATKKRISGNMDKLLWKQG